MDVNQVGYVVHDGCDHIFFVGFLGAGKSTLARNLGTLFHRRYLDTDRLVERMTKKTVCEIFEEEGEYAFRSHETQVLTSLLAQKSLLVSCGGGIVENPSNCELMHRMGTVVFLDGDLQDSLRQIQRPDKRPDFVSKDVAAKLYARLRPLYQQESDLSIDIRNKSFEQVCSQAAQVLWERGLL